MKTILVDAVFTFVSDQGEISQEMYQMLEQYPNRKILLTNANDEQFEKFGLNKMPYEVFTLKHNPEKTSPEYYKRFLEQHSLQPTDVLYFEHNPEAVKSAQQVGIPSYYYDDSKKDMNALKKFIDSNL